MPTNEQRRETAKRKLERQLERREAQAKKRRMMAIIGGATAVVVLIAAVVATVLLTRDDSATTADSGAGDPFAAESAPVNEPVADGQLPAFTPTADTGADCQYPAAREPSKPVDAPRTGEVPTEPAQVSASMATNQGNIGLMLDNGKSPCTVNSFASLAQQGYFDDTVCHRLTTTPGLSVLQCGDPTGTGSGGPGYQFANEYPTDQYPAGSPAAQSPVVYPRGTLAMANAGPGTNGSQFFLVYADSQLPPQYTVFGTIDETGLGTLDRIANAGVEGGAADGAPANEVRITSLALD
ncbi:peptidyl-prolyl cis-trans isomerase [Mycolicibacterium chitae]|uniref:Peptidyl-prolyl cis-trans isomerase n=1 Tax=Mycolicibacterium chitae TaxID=1792 RepID=A0A3S4RHP0_MYCCI|nr:peptidylprolyl isomerase [Mycolicibacterium chitae]MCV7109164.1 peptidylprolyl isomerase [Mycolicibacterium chitae]BBZ04846.1 peptidyl-prolyl cis-trans isomerase [Mycolicibacterium chitae]VEG48470.1 PpiB [Mycolicibacterium chitae]